MQRQVVPAFRRTALIYANSTAYANSIYKYALNAPGGNGGLAGLDGVLTSNPGATFGNTPTIVYNTGAVGSPFVPGYVSNAGGAGGNH